MVGAERKVIFIELSGPAGSGKSTLIKQIKESNEGGFSYAGPPQPAIWQKIVAAIRSLPILLSPSKLDFDSRRRAFQLSRALISARMWLFALPDGLYLIDEGPFRVMRDYIFFTESGMQMWRRIARAEVAKLDGNHVLIVDLKVDGSLRDERRRRRMSRLEMQDPKFNPSAKASRKQGWSGGFLKDDWEAVICDMKYPPLLREIDSSDSPEIVMRNLLTLLEGEVGHFVPRAELG